MFKLEIPLLGANHKTILKNSQQFTYKDNYHIIIDDSINLKETPVCTKIKCYIYSWSSGFLCKGLVSAD